MFWIYLVAQIVNAKSWKRPSFQEVILLEMYKLFKKLGIENFRDKIYLERMISIFKDNDEVDNFRYRSTRMLQRDYSSIRKRVKKIINNADQDEIKTMLEIEESVSSKIFVKKLVMRVKEDEHGSSRKYKG